MAAEIAAAAEEQSQKAMKSKFRESVDKIVEASKTYFINEFQELLFDGVESATIEQKLISAPGLIVSLFSHMAELRKISHRRNRASN